MDRDVVDVVHSTNSVGEFCFLTGIFGKRDNISKVRLGLSFALPQFIATTMAVHEANYEVREEALRKMVVIIRLFTNDSQSQLWNRALT